MDSNTIQVRAILLTGKEAITFPYLAFIGAVGVIGGIGYGAHKLYEKTYYKHIKKERDRLIRSIDEFEKFVKNLKESK